MKLSNGGASPLRLTKMASNHVAARTGLRPYFARIEAFGHVFVSVPPIMGVERSEPSSS